MEAQNNAVTFFRATVHGRIWVFLTFVVLVLLGVASPVLVLFGTVDLLGAAWTWSVLRRDANA